MTRPHGGLSQQGKEGIASVQANVFGDGNSKR
jgi:hypothetical protein